MATPRKRGITLGRVLGARVVLAPSTLILVAVLAAYFGASASPAGFNARAAMVGALVAAALLVSAFVHELGHVVALTRVGETPSQITVSFMGGHTSYAGLERTRALLTAALSGPAVSVAFGTMLMIIAVPLDGVAGTLVRSLGLWNVLFFGLFNALPGIPLDGGHALRAVVTARTGDRLKGMAAAAQSGRVIAVLIVIAALAVPILMGAPPNLIYLLMAVFVFATMWPVCSSVIRTVASLERLAGVTAMSVSRTAVGVPFDASVLEARELAHAAGVAEVVVLAADGQPAGHFPVMITDEVPAELRATTALMSVTMPLVRGAVIPAEAVGQSLVDAVAPWVGKTDAVAVMGSDGPVGVALLDDVVRALQ